MKSVSVIIPCYRQARLLPEAVESVLRQEFPGIEVIVVNDGSDDDTETVAARYGDRINYVAKVNGGLSSARNAGIETASGKYLLFLDADDLLAPESLERLWTAAESRDGQVAVMGWREFQRSPEVDAGPPKFPPRQEMLPAALYSNPAPVHCWLVPRAAIEDAGGFQPMCAVEDWHLWGRLAVRGWKWTRVEFAGAMYRKMPGTMSTDAMRMCAGVAEAVTGIIAEALKSEEFVATWGRDLLIGALRKRRWALYSGFDRRRLEPMMRHINQLLTQISLDAELRSEVADHHLACGRLSAREGRLLSALDEYRRAMQIGGPSGRVMREWFRLMPRWAIGSVRRMRGNCVGAVE